MAKTSTTWQEVKWPFDGDAAEYIKPVYRKKVGRVLFHLYPTQIADDTTTEYKQKYAGTWSYVASAGANSDLSHSGLVLDKSLDAAKLYCETKVETR